MTSIISASSYDWKILGFAAFVLDLSDKELRGIAPGPAWRLPFQAMALGAALVLGSPKLATGSQVGTLKYSPRLNMSS